MVKPQLIEEAPMTIAEAKAEIDHIKERDGVLSFRGTKCEEYFNDFSSITHAKASELQKKLKELNVARLRDEHIVKIVDILPKTAEEVKVVFQGSPVSISKKDMEQIAAAVQEVVK